MKLKHQFFNLYREYVWLLSRLGKKVFLGSAENSLYIITVAYNHAKLIEKQIELVKKYVKDENYRHVIVDNSPQKSVRKQIKQICEHEGVDYISVPLFIDKQISHKLFGNGLSHGAALNWMFYHVLVPNQPALFALLDHDVLPLKAFSLKEKLGLCDFYGVERNMGVGWYLWPGWCIFKYDVIEKCRPNFLPVFVDGVYLDSGGGNYKRFYSQYSLKDIDFPEVKTKRVKQTEGLFKHDDIYHGDCLQYIDHAWLHIINGSNCAHIPGKEEYVDYVLDNLEKYS
jgi:hypothetical protein